MSYQQAVKRIFALDTDIYHELEKNRRLFKTAFANLLLLGLFYGLANLYGALDLLRRESPGGFENPTLAAFVFILLVAASLASVFTVHAGFSLLAWAISRGFGGLSAFFPVYLHIGAAVPPLWIGAPLLFFYFRNLAGLPALIPGAIAAVWAFVTVTRSIMAGQNFSLVKALISLVVTVIFAISIRILMS